MNHTLFEIMRFYTLRNVITETIRICRTGHSLPRGAIFSSSLPPIVFRRTHVLFTLCSLRLYLQLFVGGLMFSLCYLCCLYILVLLSNAYCVVFLFVFLVFLVFLDCSLLLIVPSVLSNVYLERQLCERY